MTVDEAVALYAWHTRHHAAHIEVALRATHASLKPQAASEAASL
jgi:hypothetical protein